MYAVRMVNVRSMPDVDWPAVAQALEGQAVTVTARCNETGWYKITLSNGVTGYSSSLHYTKTKPISIDTSYVVGLTVPNHTADSIFTVDRGDVFIINTGAVSDFFSYDESIVKVDANGTATAGRAGHTAISYKKDGQTLFADINVYDRHLLDDMFSTKREITDDLWLTEALEIDGLELSRSTGLKLIAKNADDYEVEYQSHRFTVRADQVTDVSPVVTPTPPLPNVPFSVKPGILVNFEYGLVTTADPNDLVDISKSKVTNSLEVSNNEYCRFHKDAIIPLSVLARDCVLAGYKYFSVNSNGTYRPFALQDFYWNRRLADNPTYGDDPYNSGGTITVPGISSEHRTGFAVDISTIAGGYNWLNENSWKYGFIHRYTGDKTKYTGVQDEYWHYTYVGREIAETCYKEGLCLEEYYLLYVFVD